MKDFLENYDLYKEYLLLENYVWGKEKYMSEWEFLGQKFDYYCPIEDSLRPFELDFPDFIKSALTSDFQLDNPNTNRPKKISEEYFIEKKLNYTFWIYGKCKSCNEHKVHFLLNVFSNNPIWPWKNNTDNISTEIKDQYRLPNTNIYIQKVGCSPQKKLFFDINITKYFDRETNDWFYKAKKLLQSNIGIGSFAYLRRIIEKELLKIIEDIGKLSDSNSSEIDKLLIEYNKNPKISTIYEKIFNFLPSSLKELGNNPIKLLYNQTSEGLHSLTEKECLERAKSIEIILEFTIRKINEERSDIKLVKDAIKRLK